MLVEPKPLVKDIIGCAIEVHRALGPGLLESAYTLCLAVELTARGIAIEREVPIPVLYKEKHLDCVYRADLIVQGSLLVEVKSVERFDPVHTAQVLTYLKLLNLHEGLLLNFNCVLLKHGIKRILL